MLEPVWQRIAARAMQMEAQQRSGCGSEIVVAGRRNGTL
jgi:hypothetical protein